MNMNMNDLQLHQPEYQHQALKFVTARRAALLLGMPEKELLRISRESGYGHTEICGQEQDTFFTYEELRQICVLSVQTIH